MKAFLRKLAALCSAYYAYMLEYRAELLLWALAGSLPLIMMGLWSEAARAGNFSLSSLEFIRYFLAVFLVRQFSIIWVIWDFEQEVVEGKLSPRLLQPLDPAWHHVASHLMERLARLPFTVALMALFFLLYPRAFWIPSWQQVALGSLAVLLAFALRFLMQYTLALLAFWVERISALEQFHFLVYLFLSGVIAPLEVFPPAVRQVLGWTPFPYLVHFPASLWVGLPQDILRGFAMGLAWLGLFWLVNRWLWWKGLQRYSGMGA
ncbi:ABC transporter permease [Synechococcus sp. W70.1]|uniref:ABC transporter permease n=1 Tax=Synechococcus sp. W70.1 TaxID=2964534 RepID=UPI0039C3770E